VPALGVGGVSAGGPTNVTVPGGTALNTYFLLACADDTTVVAESAEGNNCIASATTVQVQAGAAADLVVTSLSNPPPSAPVGSIFSVTDTTRNQGGSSTVLKTKTRFYLSLDMVKSAGDKRLKGAHGVPILAAGAQHSKTRNETIPLSTAPGTYFLIACADDRFVVAESNEGNNCRTSTTQITVTP
jgi:subtilase family serine protease